MSEHDAQRPEEPEQTDNDDAQAQKSEDVAAADQEPAPAADADEAVQLAEEQEPDAEPSAEQDEEEGAEKEPAKQLPPETLLLCRSAIEAMLFSSADLVSSRKLAAVLKDTGVDGRGIRRIIRDLAKEYEESKRGFAIEELAGGFQMLSRPELAEYVADLHGGESHTKMSQAALETLAVVAYKQPVTRADIEAIRGVQAGPLLRTLLHKGLVKIAGRAEILGRPLLYSTTKKFLEHFGLKSINELPKVEELPRP